MTRNEKYENYLFDYFEESELIQLAQELIRIPSHVQHPGRETELGEFLSEHCRGHGFDVFVKPIVEKRSNVIVTLKGSSSGKTLLLNGHLDTVPPGEMDFEPYKAELKEGYIHGRGAVDMKGPIASMLTMMLALKRSPIELDGDIVFTGVIGEEEQSEGTEDLVKSGIQADGAIVGEPSSGEYSAGHRGLEWLEILIKGKAAHGGMPHLGINAIEKAAVLVQRIQDEIYPVLKQREHPLMGQSVMNFGYIKGGLQPSTVAADCILQIDRRYIPGETVESVIKEYQVILDQLQIEDKDFDASISRMPNNMLTLDHLPLETSLDDPICLSLQAALKQVFKQEPVLSTKRGWTDASLLSNYGAIPTVIYGPGKISYSHTRNEKIAVQDLLDAVKVYFLSALDFCGYSK